MGMKASLSPTVWPASVAGGIGNLSDEFAILLLEAKVQSKFIAYVSSMYPPIALTYTCYAVS